MNKAWREVVSSFRGGSLSVRWPKLKKEGSRKKTTFPVMQCAPSGDIVSTSTLVVMSQSQVVSVVSASAALTPLVTVASSEVLWFPGTFVSDSNLRCLLSPDLAPCYRRFLADC